MGIEIPVGYSEATMRWTASGDPEFMHCTLGLFDNLLTEDPVDIAARWTLAFAASGLGTAGNISTQYSRQTHFVTTRLTSGLVTVETGPATAGSAASLPLPNNCAILVRKNTALGGRRNRGRMYLPPCYFAESDVGTTGVIDAPDVSTVQGYITALMAGLASNDLTPVVLHENGSNGTVITSMIVQARIATQRTRMRR